MKAQSRQESAPIIDIFRQHKRPLVIGTLTFLGTNMAGYMIISFLLSYATNILGIDRTDVLLVQVVGSVFWVAVILATSYLTDRVGGRALFIAGFMLQVLVAVPCMLLVGTGRVLLMYPAALLLIISLGLTMGPQSAVFVSLFPTRVRYSGASSRTPSERSSAEVRHRSLPRTWSNDSIRRSLWAFTSPAQG